MRRYLAAPKGAGGIPIICIATNLGEVSYAQIDGTCATFLKKRRPEAIRQDSHFHIIGGFYVDSETNQVLLRTRRRAPLQIVKNVDALSKCRALYEDLHISALAMSEDCWISYARRDGLVRCASIYGRTGPLGEIAKAVGPSRKEGK